MTRPAPAASPERIPAVDLLRGAALLGILMVNVWFFASASLAVAEPDPDFADLPDRIAYGAATLLFATKSYLLFAFLFGYSFVLQERAGPMFPRRMRRRLTALIVLGVLHGLLLYPGDILVTYGALGFVLLAVRRIEPRAAVQAGVLLTAAAGALLALLGFAALLADGEEITGAAGQYAAQFRGPPADVLAANAATYPSALASVLFLQAVPAFGAMLVGLAAARVGFFEDRARQSQVWRAVIPRGSIVGLLGAAAFTAGICDGSTPVVLFGFAATVVTAPLLTATYVWLLAEWQRRRPGSALVNGIAATGRLALSNYLGQSLILALLFSGYGLRLMDEASATATVAIVLLIYAGQVLLSAWWVRSFRYGPAEWVLRRWTLGRGR